MDPQTSIHSNLLSCLTSKFSLVGFNLLPVKPLRLGLVGIDGTHDHSSFSCLVQFLLITFRNSVWPRSQGYLKVEGA